MRHRTQPVTRGSGQNKARITAVAALLLLSGCASGPVHGPVTPEGKRHVVSEPLTPQQQNQLALARQAGAAKNWALAQARLTSLIDARPDVGWLKARLGWIQQHQGQITQAIASYQQALTQSPADVFTVNNLAVLLQQQDRFEEAGAVLETGLAHAPGAAELHFNLAVLCELYLLELPKALAHYRRYQELAGDGDERVAGWIADLERRVN
ncbi:MAG: tetratricopeptide repeat protein [Marinobacter sp.]|uniref:tetratricopeptide repeat protein n=1 Tax=Marinobacter sp. TaxID=50741 RepID=UPI00299D6B6F|nr:tetratricopeptide repeat protein [Marinobacter sp.]MDX1754913.1 tetratricopeptide repeat protein [Marinobacter sp.]